jgi:hypothetical protein
MFKTILVLTLVIFGACGGDDDGDDDDVRATYGEACAVAADCAEDLCVPTPILGGICTRACSAGCPGADPCVTLTDGQMVCDPGGGNQACTCNTSPVCDPACACDPDCTDHFAATCSCADHPMQNHSCLDQTTVEACGSTGLSCFEAAAQGQPASDGFCTTTCEEAEEGAPCSIGGTCTRVPDPNLTADWFVCE